MSDSEVCVRLVTYDDEDESQCGLHGQWTFVAESDETEDDDVHFLDTDDLKTVGDALSTSAEDVFVLFNAQEYFDQEHDPECENDARLLFWSDEDSAVVVLPPGGIIRINDDEDTSGEYVFTRTQDGEAVSAEWVELEDEDEGEDEDDVDADDVDEEEDDDDEEEDDDEDQEDEDESDDDRDD